MTRDRMTRGDGTACVCAWRLDDGRFARETALLPSTGGGPGAALLKRANMIRRAAALRKGRRKPRRSTEEHAHSSWQLTCVSRGSCRALWHLKQANMLKT